MDKKQEETRKKSFSIINISKKKKRMSTAKIVSGAEPITLHFNYQSSPRKPGPPKISFSSQISKSRISIVNPSRIRPRSLVRAFYAPVKTAETLYQVLGIPETGATPSDVKKAYKQMARKYHPDVSPPDRVDEYTRRFIMVHEAYETLSDPESKAVYDSDLAFGGLSSSFSAKKTRQRTKETEDWRMRWQSQLDELKRRRNGGGRMSWADRMRSNQKN